MAAAGAAEGGEVEEHGPWVRGVRSGQGEWELKGSFQFPLEIEVELWGVDMGCTRREERKYG